MNNNSKNKKTYKLKNHNVILIDIESCYQQKDQDGSELCWYGSDPPGGIPSAEKFYESIKLGTVKNIPPPWSAVLFHNNSNCVFIVTDIAGLQHLFIRKVGSKIYVGPKAIKVAEQESCTIDPLGAYELMVRGNPQGGRSIFDGVNNISPATIISIAGNVQKTKYWEPDNPEPVSVVEASNMFKEAVSNTVVKQYREDDVQELTAGRDSLLILSAHLFNDLPVKTWTHGYYGHPDLEGATERARVFNVPHQAIKTEPLLEINDKSIIELGDNFMKVSGAQANIIEYWHLPWVVEKVEGRGSITGVGGEVFRGFYYEWVGKGGMPRWLGKRLLLRGKIRDKMSYSNPTIKKKIRNMGDKLIKSDVYNAMLPDPLFWHSLDRYYLTGRMHYFAGTTFSAVSKWKKVRAPLFDFDVLDCLKYIPIKERGWSSGLVADVTKKYLHDKDMEVALQQSYETLSFRIARLIKRLSQMRGTNLPEFQLALARRYLNIKEVKQMLRLENMVTADLYKDTDYMKLYNKIYEGHSIPIFFGAILTIEMAARELGSCYNGIRVP